MADTGPAAAQAGQPRAALQPRHVRRPLSHGILPGEKTVHNLLSGLRRCHDPHLLLWLRVLPLLGFLFSGDRLPL